MAEFAVYYYGTSQASLGPPAATEWYLDGWLPWAGTLVVGDHAITVQSSYFYAYGTSQAENFEYGSGSIEYFSLWASGVNQDGQSVVVAADAGGIYERSYQQMTLKVEGPAKLCDSSVPSCWNATTYLASSRVTIVIEAHVTGLGVWSSCNWSACIAEGVYEQTPSSDGLRNYGYTGGAQTFTVPAGVTRLHVDVNAARGGRVRGDLGVVPGETLWLYVGGFGGTSSSNTSLGGVGGFNGGGKGGNGSALGHGADGGNGASDIRKGGVSLSNRVVVAGGSGGQLHFVSGGFFQCGIAGGSGGGLSGGSGRPFWTGVTRAVDGKGATQSWGGEGGYRGGSYGMGGSGFFGSGGDGATGITGGGGGGGGYYGGGGGGDGDTSCHPSWGVAGGGGGGSGYTDPVVVTNAVQVTGGSIGRSIRLQWDAVTPGVLRVAPPLQARSVGQSVAVAAEVLDDTGAPIWGLPITFERQGPHAGTVIVETDATGVAVLTYVGEAAGTDTISVTVEGAVVDEATAVVIWDGVPSTSVPPTTLPPTTVPPISSTAGIGKMNGSLSFHGSGLPPPTVPCSPITFTVNADGEGVVVHTAATAYTGPASIAGEGAASCGDRASSSGDITLAVSGESPSGASLSCPSLAGTYEQRFGFWRSSLSGDCILNGLPIGPATLTLIGHFSGPGPAVDEPVTDASLEVLAILREGSW